LIDITHPADIAATAAIAIAAAATIYSMRRS
jgi:hypothetical protein